MYFVVSQQYTCHVWDINEHVNKAGNVSRKHSFRSWCPFYALTCWTCAALRAAVEASETRVLFLNGASSSLPVVFSPLYGSGERLSIGVYIIRVQIGSERITTRFAQL